MAAEQNIIEYLQIEISFFVHIFIYNLYSFLIHIL